MTRAYFQSIEKRTQNDTLALNEVINELEFNGQGLIPVITQDADSKQVLMMAWMNKMSLEKTIEKGRMIYWSRSRNELWEKGATSGHTQQLVAMSFDCDGDAILCQVKQVGAACHTGRPDCFYLKVDTEQQQVLVAGNIS
jgi:phosphoribosyl-AMP cyclohydrolase